MARCLEFPSLVAHGGTIEEALKEIEYVVAESVKWMQEEDETVPEPLSVAGPCTFLAIYLLQVMFRLTPDMLHKADKLYYTI